MVLRSRKTLRLGLRHHQLTPKYYAEIAQTYQAYGWSQTRDYLSQNFPPKSLDKFACCLISSRLIYCYTSSTFSYLFFGARGSNPWCSVDSSFSRGCIWLFTLQAQLHQVLPAAVMPALVQAWSQKISPDHCQITELLVQLQNPLPSIRYYWQLGSSLPSNALYWIISGEITAIR